jgi:hypothetical protein
MYGNGGRFTSTRASAKVPKNCAQAPDTSDPGGGVQQ